MKTNDKAKSSKAITRKRKNQKRLGGTLDKNNGPALMVVPSPVRCTRHNGSKWRCPKERVDGRNFCQHHYSYYQLQLKKKKIKMAEPGSSFFQDETEDEEELLLRKGSGHISSWSDSIREVSEVDNRPPSSPRPRDTVVEAEAECLSGTAAREAFLEEEKQEEECRRKLLEAEMAEPGNSFFQDETEEEEELVLRQRSGHISSWSDSIREVSEVDNRPPSSPRPRDTVVEAEAECLSGTAAREASLEEEKQEEECRRKLLEAEMAEPGSSFFQDETQEDEELVLKQRSGHISSWSDSIREVSEVDNRPPSSPRPRDTVVEAEAQCLSGTAAREAYLKEEKQEEECRRKLLEAEMAEPGSSFFQDEIEEEEELLLMQRSGDISSWSDFVGEVSEMDNRPLSSPRPCDTVVEAEAQCLSGTAAREASLEEEKLEEESCRKLLVAEELLEELDVLRASEKKMKEEIVALENLLSSTQEDLKAKVRELDEIKLKLHEDRFQKPKQLCQCVIL